MRKEINLPISVVQFPATFSGWGFKVEKKKSEENKGNFDLPLSVTSSPDEEASFFIGSGQMNLIINMVLHGHLRTSLKLYHKDHTYVFP